jgi:hypothetical protein
MREETSQLKSMLIEAKSESEVQLAEKAKEIAALAR